MRYIGFFANGETIKRQNLTDLSQISRVEYILKIDEAINERGYPYDTAVTLINCDGTLKTFTIGGFELLDLGSLYYNQELKNYVDATFCELRISEIFHVPIKYNSDNLIYDGLIPLMKQLERIGSYASYIISLENEQLKIKNAELQNKLDDFLRQV